VAPASELSIITGRYKSVTIRAMAKARQALSPTREADPLEWLTAELRSRFDDVRDKIPPALDPGKVKDVHHLRVAIRRLHSLLGDVNEIVESPALKHLQKALKKRVNRLGRVRDRDVYIEALEELSSEAGEGKYAKTIDYLIEEDHSERKHAHRKLNRTFSKASNEDLEDQVSSAVKKALEQPGLFRPDSVRSAGHEIVSSRLKDLTELAGDLYDPNDEKGLHKIRIAAKRLRYTLEVFVPAFGEKVQEIADEVSRLQTFLGNLHDYDIWMEGLRTRLRDAHYSHKLDDSDRKAITWILSEFVEKRTENYRSALDLWTNWETDSFRGKIKELIDK